MVFFNHYSKKSILNAFFIVTMAVLFLVCGGSAAQAARLRSASINAFSRIDAEKYSSQNGVVVSGGSIAYLDNGDYVAFNNVDFGSGATGIQFFLAVDPAYAGQQIEIRIDSLAGTLIGTHTVLNTGGWGTYALQSDSIAMTSGTHKVYLIFKGAGGICNLDYFTFLAAPPSQSYSLSISSPATGATVNGSIQIRGAGPGFLNVEIYSSVGALLGRATPDASGNFSAAVDTTKLSNGTQVLTVDAWDSPAGQPFTHTAEKKISLNVQNGVAPAPAPSPTPAPTPAPAPQQTQVLTLATPQISAQAGQNIAFTTRFNAVPMDKNYTVFVHFVNSSGANALGADYNPSTPTTQWSGLVSSDRTVALPSTLPAGSYSIRIGLYEPVAPYTNRATLAMGPGVTVDSENRYTVGTLQVAVAAPSPQPAPAPSPAPSPAPAPSGALVSPSFFGMHFSSAMYQPWPVLSFSSLRTWDQYPGVGWSNLNSARGTYDWTNLDAVVNAASAKGVDIVYTFGFVPSFASTNPSGACDGSPAGSCFAPNISDWKDFVTALTNRYKGKIKYYELWNEPNSGNFYKGTAAEMVSMAQAAYSIIKNSGGTVLSPAPQGTNSHQWLDSYFAAGGAQYTDIVTFHGYLYGAPELIVTLANNVKSTMAKYNLSSKPLWDTEHSWGDPTWPFGADQDQQSAWLARYLPLSFSSNIQRSFWYMYDSYQGQAQWGPLFDATSKTLLKPGIAYREVYNWMVNGNMSPCTQSGSVYQCSITRTGYQGLIVWNTSGNSSFNPGSGFTKVRYLDGTSAALSSGASVNIGIKPVLIERNY